LSGTHNNPAAETAAICETFGYEAFIVQRGEKIAALPAITALGKNTSWGTDIESRNVLIPAAMRFAAKPGMVVLLFRTAPVHDGDRVSLLSGATGDRASNRLPSKARDINDIQMIAPKLRQSPLCCSSKSNQRTTKPRFGEALSSADIIPVRAETVDQRINKTTTATRKMMIDRPQSAVCLRRLAIFTAFATQ
jgi:hypothetical protein